VSRSLCPLDRRVTRIIAALGVTGLVSGGGCAYRVANGSFSTCVSKTARDLAGAAD